MREEPKGTVRHTLERIPVGDEKKLVALRTKGVSCAVDASLKISYDPKRAHEVFVASRHPRMARWQSEAVVAVIGVALMLYVLIRWGLS
ncbi:hypothetical protein [Streptomyces syringium]|uniref:hypothetical protein n=1 Tax=Streptomyces syringium TaxID=76729 RepID=UPI0037D0CCCA